MTIEDIDICMKDYIRLWDKIYKCEVHVTFQVKGWDQSLNMKWVKSRHIIIEFREEYHKYI